LSGRLASPIVLGRFLDDSFAPEVRADITALTTARLAANSCYRYSAPFLATIARGLDVSLEQVGVALAIAELGGLLSPLTGRLVDRWGQRASIVGGLLGMALGTALAASSHGVAMFAVALVVLSQGKIVFDIGLGSWIVTHVPYERRGVVVGITETSWALGLLIGVSLMGLVTAATNWRGAYVLAAAGAVTMATVVARRIGRESTSMQAPEPRSMPAVRVEGTHAVQRIRLGSAAWLAVGGSLCLMASSQCLFVTFGGWLEDSFDFTPASLSAVTFALGLGELVSSVTSARRTDRWGKERSAAMGAGLMIPSAIGLAIWNEHLAVGLVLLVIAVTGFEFAIVSSLAFAGTLVPRSPARGLGLMIGAGTLGRALLSIPATRLYERSGLGWPAIMSAVLAGGTVVAMLARSRTRPLAA
jgi:DHA1 family inner membrane transport protein